MLRRASVADVKSGKCTRRGSHLVIAMRFYPRFLKRDKVDEYVRDLSPPADLLKEFKEKEREIKDHNKAFEISKFEARFKITEKGMERLEELSKLSTKTDVVLICQCNESQKCHCDLLLILARSKFSAPISGLTLKYPRFKKN